MSKDRLELWQRRLYNGLGPLAFVYKRLMRMRSLAFQKRLLSSWRPPGICLSVGNLSWGGTGKTPLCQWLTSFFQDKDQRVCLLTRGYKGQKRLFPYLVCPDSPVSLSADEPLMLARANRQAYVVVDPKRTRGGKWVAKDYNPDVYLLDDGFQHQRVQRDIDLVILGQTDLGKQWNQVLPQGQWREDLSALFRASAIILHLSSDMFQHLSPEIAGRLSFLRKPVFSFYLNCCGFQRVFDQSFISEPLSEPYLLVSGVGDPKRVELTANQAMRQKPQRHLVFPDHHWFSWSDWVSIKQEADRKGCSTILCTQKDAVKLEKYADLSLWSINMEVKFGPYLGSPMSFSDWLEHKIKTTIRPASN